MNPICFSIVEDNCQFFVVWNSVFFPKSTLISFQRMNYNPLCLQPWQTGKPSFLPQTMITQGSISFLYSHPGPGPGRAAPTLGLIPEGAWEQKGRLRGRISPRKVALPLLDLYFLITAGLASLSLSSETSGFKESDPTYSGASPGFLCFGCYVRASVPKRDFSADETCPILCRLICPSRLPPWV